MQRVQVLAQLFGNFTIRGAQLVWGESQHAAGCRPIAPASAPDSPLLTGEAASRLDPLPVNPGHRSGLHGGFRDQFKRAGDALFVVFVPAADPKCRGTITVVHFESPRPSLRSAALKRPPSLARNPPPS